MKKIIVILSLLITTACGVSSSSGVIGRDTNKGGFMGLKTLADVEVSGEEAIKGKKKVIVGSFKIGFIESSSNSRKAGGGLLSNGFGGKASGKTKLTGVEESLKQKITDAAYNNFVAELKANGFEVVDNNNFFGYEKYKKANKISFPYKSDKSGLLSKYGVTNFYQPTSFGKEGIIFAGDIANKSGGFGFGNGGTVATEYAIANETPVISASYVVDFAAASGYGGKFTSSASVKVGQNLAVTSANVKFASGYTSTFKDGMTIVSIGQPISSDKEFGEIVESTTSVNKAVQEAVNVVSIFAGAGTNRSREYVIKADPVKYKESSTDLIKKVNKFLLEKAATLR